MEMNKEKVLKVLFGRAVLFERALNELRKRIKNSEAKWEVFMPEQIRVFSADETLLIFKWWKELESWHTWREIELKHSGKEKYIQPLGFGKKLPKIIRHKEGEYKLKIPQQLFVMYVEDLKDMEFCTRVIYCTKLRIVDLDFFCHNVVNHEFQDWLRKTDWSWKGKEEGHWDDFTKKIRPYFDKFCQKIKISNPSVIRLSWQEFIDD